MVSASIHRPGLRTTDSNNCCMFVCLFNSLKSKEWHLKGGEWQAKSVVCTSLDTWPRYKVIIFRDRWETKTPPKLCDIVTCTSHLCHIFVTIHDCIVRARVDDCTTVIMQFLSCLVSLIMLLFVYFLASLNFRHLRRIIIRMRKMMGIKMSS